MMQKEATWLFNLGLKVILITGLMLVFKLSAHAANPCIVYLSRISPQRNLELTAARDGRTVGKIVYTHTDGDAYIGAILVDHLSRGSGVSTELIRHMLEREEPTTSVSAVLILDNYRASGLGRLHRDATFEECVEAVKKTPLYKTVSKFGFARVTQCVHAVRTDMISISVGLL